MAFGLSSNGLLIKRFADILAEIQIALRADFGDEANVDPEFSFLGKNANIYSEPAAQAWELLQAIHDSAYPDSAEGINLDGVADYTGIERLAATNSTVTVTATGTPGTPLLAGRIIEVQGTGNRFETISDATIGGGGTVNIATQAQQTGSIQAPATTLTIIVTPVIGWTSVINASDADVGRNIENDAELRLRRLQSLQVIGAAAVDAIRSRIIDDVSGVTDAFVFENDSIVPDSGGRPPKSVHCIVAGGAAQDVADKIWEVKAGGIETAGVAGGTPKAITGAFADAGGGKVTVTAAIHGFSEGDIVVQIGTTNYNGGFFISNVGANTYEIISAFTAEGAGGTARVPTPDNSETVVDSMLFNHTIEFDLATEIPIWMHIEINVGTSFNQGVKQQDVVEIKNAINGATYTVSINGVDFSYTATVPADTTTIIASALITLITNHNPKWVPADASESGPADEFVNLLGDYEGSGYLVTASATLTGDIEVLSGSHVDATGDQVAIISDVIDFAEGTEILPKEQTIGKDVYLSRYFTPVNETPDINSISITTADTAQPTTVPPGGGDWSAANVSIDATEVAQFDTLRVTVKLV